MDDLLSRHRKELRDLTARTTQKKKAATKKTRKGVLCECEALERDLRERQSREIAELAGPGSALVRDEDSAAEDPTVPSPPAEEPTTTAPPAPPEPTAPPSKKPSRSKARLARRAADLAALSAAAEAEAASLPDLRSREIAAMQSRLSGLQLTEHAIAPDGHCLYSAFADQVQQHLGAAEQQPDYRLARRKCAAYMASHRADFEPFLDEPFDEHVRKVAETAEWGGQTEVLALAKAFGVVANVVQAEGRGVERMNEGGGKEVWLGYYRHSFGLGEHYNSLRRKE